MRYRARITRRERAIQHAWSSGDMAGVQAIAAKVPVKRGPQPEGETNKSLAKWAALHPELVIGRNKRRLAVPVGWHKAILLGWLIDGSSDWIGYRTLTITPSMVGKRISQFVAIEAKRHKGGRTSDAQKLFLKAAQEAGAVAGVARNAAEAEALLTEWENGGSGE